MNPTRPPFRYHGSKWRIAPWVIAHMPAHTIYVEAFGGSASVLLRKPPAKTEVYNDLDGRVVNVFRVLQSPAKAELLRRRLELTPYARAEFDSTYEPPMDDIDDACKTIMLSQMGYGTDSIGRTCRTGFRSKLSGSGFTPAVSWATWPRQVPNFVDRLQGVVIEQRDGREVMQRMDSRETLHYVDPPYVTSTRSSLNDGRRSSHGYRHEMTDVDHISLAECLAGLQGMVLLSGYPSALYDELYATWTRFECRSLADGAKPRKECLWLNATAAQHGNGQQSFPVHEVFPDEVAA